MGADGIDCFICSPLPGTAFWDYAMEHGNINMEHYETNPPDFMSPDNAYIVDRNMSKEKLIKKHAEIVAFLETFSQRRSIKILTFVSKGAESENCLKGH